MTSADDRKHLAALHSVLCTCGSVKISGQSFCRTCFFILPIPERKALYNKIGAGYAEAFAAALKTLTARNRVRATP
jgi:hypothetical protein